MKNFFRKPWGKTLVFVILGGVLFLVASRQSLLQLNMAQNALQAGHWEASATYNVASVLYALLGFFSLIGVPLGGLAISWFLSHLSEE